MFLLVRDGADMRRFRPLKSQHRAGLRVEAELNNGVGCRPCGHHVIDRVPVPSSNTQGRVFRRFALACHGYCVVSGHAKHSRACGDGPGNDCIVHHFARAAGKEGLPERELKRFEVHDGNDYYASLLGGDTGALHIVGELVPSSAGKKDNAELKPVVVTLQHIEEVKLRSDVKSAQYWVRTPHAWYQLASPLPRYQDCWKHEAMTLKVR
jgi:hypothetical protein